MFERLFKERSLPANIRSDNGVSFASAHALFNLSKLAVWWLRQGIGIERIKPGHPEQNGRHERMHLTLKKEATKPAAGNFLQQQARFDDFIEVFNNERPHEALEMKCPAEVYQPSTHVYPGLPDIDYPFQVNVDFSLAKLFLVSESQTFEFRAEFFNLFNHPNFANPISNLNAGRIDQTTGQTLNSGNFGRIISTSNNPRIIQFAFKFNS